MRCEEGRAGRCGVWDEVLSDARTVSQGEAQPMEEDVRETKKDKLVPAISLRRRKSSDAHIMMRYQSRLDVLERRQGLLNSANILPSVASAPTMADSRPVDRNDCFSKTGSQATDTRNGSCGSSGSSITLSAQEEQVFFDKVRKELPAEQRTIDSKVLRCMDRLQEHCECQTCDKWREVKLGIKGQAEQEHEWKTNWKFLLRRVSLITKPGAERLVPTPGTKRLGFAKPQANRLTLENSTANNEDSFFLPTYPLHHFVRTLCQCISARIRASNTV